MLAVRRVRLASCGDVRVDVLPAVPGINRLYAAAAASVLRPIALAALLGRVSEVTARSRLAEIYAETVVVGSPDAALASLDRAGWAAWLDGHPREFALLRAVCEDAALFEGGPCQVEVEIADPAILAPPPSPPPAGAPGG